MHGLLIITSIFITIVHFVSHHFGECAIKSFDLTPDLMREKT